MYNRGSMLHISSHIMDNFKLNLTFPLSYFILAQAQYIINI
jgi:hypothetical protein